MNRFSALFEIIFISFFVSICLLYDLISDKIKNKELKYIGFENLTSNLEKESWIYYLTGFRSSSFDGFYSYWNYSINKIEKNIPTISTFYPFYGYYSSNNKTLIDQHIQHLIHINVTGLIIPFYSKSFPDPYHNQIDDSLSRKVLFESIKKSKLKIGILIPYYESRTWNNIFDSISEFLNEFKQTKSILYHLNRPVIFIENSSSLQNTLLTLTNIRKTRNDCYFIAIPFSFKDNINAIEDGYDAISSFYPTNEFSWTSNPNNWKNLHKLCEEKGMPFIPSVSPGYNSSHLGNTSRTTMLRRGGKYFDEMWEKAILTNPNIIFINSYNNFLESTNIEPVIEKINFSLDDRNWASKDSFAFIDFTKKWISNFYNLTEN